MSRSRGYTIVEHPSDVGIEAHGQTLGEAFEEAAYGMFSMISERGGVRPLASRKVAIVAADAGQLLVKWLSELLYLYDGEKFLPALIRIEELSETGLTADVSGEKFDPSRHAPLTDIKAVTYHQLHVDREHHAVRVFLDA